ncbi:MAG: hypothetical protein BGO31_12655 [Bacteroidetes bacterium 43-16]|nr:MAG: hypothetical protein BGO31_12655 [Bacteroidetes bacterium 43-16]
MKRNILLFAIAVSLAAMGCQKNLQDNQSIHDQLSNDMGAQNITVDCTPIVLSGSITTNTTLLTGKTYLLDGIVDVKSATLTIQPGTLILGKSSVASALVIDRTAQINAVGTATSPIVFTSDKTAGTRAAGDWLGLFIFGNAPNNQSNALGFSIEGNSYTAGGTLATSSAGSLQYVQVHYAGKGSSTGDRLTESALVLGSIGSGMTIRNIQISHSQKDGLGMYGGTVGVKEVFSYKSERIEFPISQGYRGNIQSILGFKDNVTTAATNVAMVDISNNLIGTNNSPFTYPTISNASLLGGSYCTGDGDYNRGIVIRENGSAQIYNSVIEGFSQYGLYLDGAAIVAKTQAVTDQLIFSYNSLHDLGSPQYAANFAPASDWVTGNGCRLIPTAGTMQNWIDGTAHVNCTQAGNQFLFNATGYYKNSLCGDKCSTFPNLYVDEVNTELDAPNYTMLSGFFDQPDYRGSLQSSSDTWLQNTWVDFCMLSRNYCQ